MSHKPLKYYKNLDYNIIIEKQMEDDEQWYIAFTNELGKLACYGRGDTQAEALASFFQEKDAFIEHLFSEGKHIPLPEPHAQKFSGVFNVRTSPTIHANLVTQAKQQGISLNLYLNQILAGAVERKAMQFKVKGSTVCRG